MDEPKTSESPSAANAESSAVRSGAWLGRFCVCARWDGRWVVVVAQTKADAHAIATDAVRRAEEVMTKRPNGRLERQATEDVQ